MAYQIDKEKCVDCGYCGYICPFGAIEEKEEAGKYYYANVSRGLHSSRARAPRDKARVYRRIEMYRVLSL